VAGCPFQRRCPHAVPGTCETVTPPWREADGGHRIRCHLDLHDLRDLASATPATAAAKELETS
jgi:peptide/nickel transport system ATP-binding protein